MLHAYNLRPFARDHLSIGSRCAQSTHQVSTCAEKGSSYTLESLLTIISNMSDPETPSQIAASKPEPRVLQWAGYTVSFASAASTIWTAYQKNFVLAGVSLVGLALGIMLIAIVHTVVREVSSGSGRFWTWFARCVPVVLTVYIVCMGIAIFPDLLQGTRKAIHASSDGHSDEVSGDAKRDDTVEISIKRILEDRDVPNAELEAWLQTKPRTTVTFASTGRRLVTAFARLMDQLDTFANASSLSPRSTYRLAMGRLQLATDLVTTLEPLIHALPSSPESTQFRTKAESYLKRALEKDSDGNPSLVELARSVEAQMTEQRNKSDVFKALYNEYIEDRGGLTPAMKAAIDWNEAKLFCLKALLRPGDTVLSGIAHGKVTNLARYSFSGSSDPASDPQMKPFVQ